MLGSVCLLPHSRSTPPRPTPPIPRVHLTTCRPRPPLPPPTSRPYSHARANDTAREVKEVRPRGEAVVVQPGTAKSFWQPEPANGYTEILLDEHNTKSTTVSMGIQHIAVGGHIRLHQHAVNEEILHFLKGNGKILIDGVSHPIVPGTVVYVGPWRQHSIHNEGEEELVMAWTFFPPGLEKFFESVGRPRDATASSSPPPFPRPADVLATESRTAFAPISAAPK